MADETAPDIQPAPNEKGPALISSVRWSNQPLAKEFAQVLEFRQRKGKSKNASDFIEQMFNYLKNNPYGDFPTGR
jgi:hypothetical protein